VRKLISLITLLSFSVQAATITDDKLTVGKKASASAKEIVFDTNDGAANKKLSVDKVTKKLSITSDEAIVGDGTQSDKALTFNRGGSNAQVKWNELTDKLQFSNDGTTFKDLGTGGGGGGGSTGVNVLTNDSFEDAVGGVITDWSNTGGTFTQGTYTNGVEGNTKYAQFVATGSGQYFETSLFTIPTNFSGGCQADFKKVNVSTNDLFKVEVLDSSANVLSTGNVKASSWVKFPTINFTCPTAGTQIKLRVTSLSAGTIQVDDAYLGSNQNLVYVSQAKLKGTSTWTANTGCTWGTTSASWTDPSANASCNNPTITGELEAPATKVPRIVIKNAQAGDYYFVAQGMFLKASGSQGQYRFSDGTNSTTPITNAVSSASSVTGVVTGTLSRTSFSSSWEVKLQLAVGGGITNQIENDSPANFEDFQVQVYFYPASSDIAVSPEQASWLIDANIGGADATATGIVSTYTEITSASLDMVINSSKGSSNAEIPCSGTNPSSGLTCSTGNESVGVAFTPPYAGLFEACFSYSSNYGSGTAGLQVVETANNSQTILQEGGTRYVVTQQSGSTGDYAPQKNCGTFNFSDTSKRTLRLMAEINTATTLTVRGARDSSVGQPDIHITVRPLLSAFNRPILLDTPIVKASYWLSANFAAGLTTPVNYDQKEYDSHNAVTVSPTAWKFTAPIAGLYRIGGMGYWGTVNNETNLYKNGSLYEICGYTANAAGSRGWQDCMVQLNQGDYIDLRPGTASNTMQGGAFSGNSTSRITIVRLGL